MQPPTSEFSAGRIPSSQDLPYGPLPVRGEPITGPSGSPPLDQLVDLSWLALGDAPPPQPGGADRARGQAAGPSAGPPPSADEPAAMESNAARAARADAHVNDGEDGADGLDDAGIDGEEGVGADGEEAAGTEVAGPAAGVSLTTPRPETDDDVHFGVAARALGVSRKTVERMVKRGQLERGPSNAPATVSKRSLVTALEGRRRDVSHLARATEIEQSQSPDQSPAPSPQAAASALTELVPVLAPLLDEFVAARTRTAVLEHELERLRDRAGQDRARDELLLALATKGWWGRRKTRQAVLRQYVLGEHADSGSSAG